jgi:hypothetical protein
MFTIPDGWQPYHTAPDHVKKAFRRPKADTWALVNLDTMGMITIKNLTKNKSFSQIMYLSESHFEEIFANFRKQVAEESGMVFSEHNLYRQNLKQTQNNFTQNPEAYHPEIFYNDKMAGKIEGYDITGGTFWFIYPCGNGQSCFTTFILESINETYAQNLKSMETILASMNVGGRYAAAY